MDKIFRSKSITALAEALSKFQANQKPIVYNSRNPFLKNDYADLTALIEGTQENLGKHGLSVTQLLGENSITTLLMHASGECIGSKMKIEPFESKGTNKAQQLGIVITYSRRYAYAAILGLVTDKDTDGHISTPQKNKTQATDKAQFERYQKAARERIANWHKGESITDQEKEYLEKALAEKKTAKEIETFINDYKKKLPKGTEKPQDITKADSPAETTPEPEKVPQDANAGDLDTFIETWIDKPDDEIYQHYAELKEVKKNVKLMDYWKVMKFVGTVPAAFSEYLKKNRRGAICFLRWCVEK